MEALDRRDYATVIAQMTPLADAGDPVAIGVLAKLNWFGLGLPMDKRRARSLAEKAAAKDEVRGLQVMGLVYLDENPKNVPLAVEMFQRGVERDYPDALHSMAVLYSTGEGVPIDAEKALSLYERAAVKGYRSSQFNLSLALEKRDRPGDKAKSLRWLKAAADQRHAKAAFLIGNKYYFGKGVPEDKRLGCRYYLISAEEGFGDSQYYAGRCFLDGSGMQPDNIKARAWLQKAANQGHAASQVALGSMFEKGLGGIKDPGEAAALYRKAADAGQANGQTYYAIFLMTGRGGVSIDETLAISYLRKAAAQGNLQAMTNLAIILHNRASLRRQEDCKEIANLLERAASEGYTTAFAVLGDYHVAQRCEIAGYLKALELYSKCPNDPHCQFRKGVMMYYGLGTPINQTTGLNLIRGAATGGYAPAKSWLLKPHEATNPFPDNSIDL